MHADRFNRWSLAWIAGGLALGLVCARADAADAVIVGVRSSLSAPAEAAAQGRIYTVLTIQQISAWQKLVPPVDVNALLRQVHQSLAAQGFQPAKARQPPEIVLTVEYGRDWLDNPYLGDPGDPSPVNGVTSVTGLNGSAHPLEKLPNQTLTGAPVQLMNHIGRGVEARAQKAGYEKLYLRITAWQYQPDPKGRAKELWTTIMAVDDPDHADFNVLAAGMLTAGAPYFSRAIAEPELEVSAPVPDGRVKLGAPQVVDAPVTPRGHKFPMQVSVSISPGEPAKSFDLPAGEAITTLREFARQADSEIIYSSAQISGIKTHAVGGELPPHVALERLLEGTGLIAIPDEKSGAFVIRPSPGH